MSYGTKECDVGNADYYSCAMPVLIRDWRQSFRVTAQELPFLCVQLQPYTQSNHGTDLALLRLAQPKGLQVPNTAMISAVDLGNKIYKIFIYCFKRRSH